MELEEKSGAGCFAFCDTDPNCVPIWCKANSNRSKQWQTMETGFGYQRNCSFLDAALQCKRETNRATNSSGQLAGRILFYNRIRDVSTDYEKIAAVEEPTIKIKRGMRFFAKAFLSVPLGRTPIGENNLPSSSPVRGRGAVLLASRPRAIAIYIKVDGELKDMQYFFQDVSPIGIEDSENAMLEMNQNELIPQITRELTKPIKKSFLTYTVNQSQEPYCFIHLPLIGSLKDTSLATGNYGESVVRGFCYLLTTLTPGKHKIEMSLRYRYDHTEYNYLVLGQTTNPLGRWGTGLPNECLLTPHQNPLIYQDPAEPIATGSCVIVIEENFGNPAEVLLDRKPPVEVKLKEAKLQFLRKTAMTVAAGKFSDIFDVVGLPSWLILTSDLTTRTVSDPDPDSPHIDTYTYIEFAALYLNAKDIRPDGIGTLIPGSMCKLVRRNSRPVKGASWTWMYIRRDGKPERPRKIAIKNRYIRDTMQNL